jgi:hypothetical protein
MLLGLILFPAPIVYHSKELTEVALTIAEPTSSPVSAFVSLSSFGLLNHRCPNQTSCYLNHRHLSLVLQALNSKVASLDQLVKWMYSESLCKDHMAQFRKPLYYYSRTS